jgi:hypothetical protein
LADARNLEIIEPKSVDAVITSPPYPNEKDYTRTTRLESVLLGFINSKEELRELKKRLIRSNTRGIYKGDNDDEWVTEFPEIQRLADEIEKRRIDLGKDSGFEKLYSTATKLYFGGMAKHLSDLRKVLRPGAQLAYVVGDQASYLRVMIRTGQILGDIAQKLGYELAGIDLFRLAAGDCYKRTITRRSRNSTLERVNMENKGPNRYTRILEAIFERHYKKGVSEIDFERAEFTQVADELGIVLPKNLGDVLYSFRYRTLLPKSIIQSSERLRMDHQAGGQGKIQACDCKAVAYRSFKCFGRNQNS